MSRLPSGSLRLPDGAAGFTTEIDSGKVKRIRNNPSVTLQPCNMRGKVTGTPVVNATAEVLLGADARPVTQSSAQKVPGRDLAARCRLACFASCFAAQRPRSAPSVFASIDPIARIAER